MLKMSREIVLSIKSEHLCNILNGNKKLEIRKTVPKYFKGWVNLYCTLAKPYLTKESTYYETYNIPHFGDYDLNGKVVARFWFDKYKTYILEKAEVSMERYDKDIDEYNVPYEDLGKLNLDYRDILNYGKGKNLYAWNIKNLEIFETPKTLSEFKIANPDVSNIGSFGWAFDEEELPQRIPLKKAPQSWCYVYVEGETKNE